MSHLAAKYRSTSSSFHRPNQMKPLNSTTSSFMQRPNPLN